jgi:hypothetical protein
MKNFYFDVEFASEAKELEGKVPSGYIDKTVCGCGLTTVGLESNGNTVIAVPTTDLVMNKVSQYPNNRCSYKILGVTGETDKSDIMYYLAKSKPFKIMVTYDSINKVKFLLDEAHLIIDESNMLLSYASMKAYSKKGNIDVINNLLNVAEAYKDSVSFISATPLPKNYFGREWINQLEDVKMYWSNTIKVKPILLHRNYVKRALMYEVLDPIMKKGSVTLGDRTFSKCIIYYNSVKAVREILTELEIPLEDVAIKCGDSLINDFKIKGLNRLTDCKKLPKFTFVTSSGFSGSDLYDEEAMNVVVSNTGKNWQLIDLSTDLKQAISRQRIKNNPNYDRFVFIYDTSVFSVTEEELLNRAEADRKSAGYACNELNNYKGTDDYEAVYHAFEDNFSIMSFINEVDGKWQFNEVLFNSEVYFITKVRKEYMAGFSVMDKLEDGIVVEPTVLHNPLSFTSIAEKYESSLTGKVEWTKAELSCDYYKLIHQYYTITGEVSYNSKYVKDKVNNQGEFSEIKAECSKFFKTGNRYDGNEVKKVLNRIYEGLGLKRKAKATDLMQIYKEVKPVKVRGERMYEIVKK